MLFFFYYRYLWGRGKIVTLSYVRYIRSSIFRQKFSNYYNEMLVGYIIITKYIVLHDSDRYICRL